MCTVAMGKFVCMLRSVLLFLLQVPSSRCASSSGSAFMKDQAN